MATAVGIKEARKFGVVGPSGVDPQTGAAYRGLDRAMNDSDDNGSNGNGYEYPVVPCRRVAASDLSATAGLSDRHRMFVTAYLKTGNASEAARKAGFNWPGQKGAKLLKTAKIRAAINTELERSPISRSVALALFSELAFVNLGNFIDEQGQPVVEKIRAGGRFVKKYKARVIRSLSTDQVTVTQVQFELHDRQKALVTLGKMLGMFSKRGLVDRAKGNAVRGFHL